MILRVGHVEGVTRIYADVPALLETAGVRLRRQKRYAQPLSKGQKRAACLDGLLDRASSCMAELARPAAVLMPVPAEPATSGARIAGRVMIGGVDLARDVAGGGKVAAYLLTLGYDNQRAFEWLEGDYIAHHVQSDLASEVLFVLGRQLFDAQRARLPAGARLRRVTVRTGTPCGQRQVWDAAKVQALIELFGDANPGVSVTDTGCFQPLHSILGLTIALDQGLSLGAANMRP